MFEKEEVDDGTTPPVPNPVNNSPDLVDEELRDIETRYKTLKVIATKFIKSDDWIAMI